jgi:CRISPR-associated protein Csy2
MKKILVIPRIKIQNANALSSPYTIGFPAMTAWLGTMHALQLKLNQDKELKDLKFMSIAIVSHKFNLHTHRTGYDYSIISTNNPLKRDGGRPSTIEEARCHLTVSLVSEYSDIDQDEAEYMKQKLKSTLHKMKMASGDIIHFQKPLLKKITTKKDFEKLTGALMPGYCLISRQDLITQAMQNGQDAIDALLDYLKNTSSCKKTFDKEENKEKITWSKASRKEKGWLVPIGTGFYGISDLTTVDNQRDVTVKHRFAESIVTLGEFVMPYSITNLDNMLWQYSINIEDNLYLCKQNEPFINNQQENQND